MRSLVGRHSHALTDESIARRQTWLRLHNRKHNAMNPRHQAISTPRANMKRLSRQNGQGDCSIGNRQAGNERVAWSHPVRWSSLHQESSYPPTHLQPALRTIIRYEPALSSNFQPCFRWLSVRLRCQQGQHLLTRPPQSATPPS